MTHDLDVLADGTRRLMLALLAAESELCVCELEAALGLVQPVISRQLAVLREAGWVSARREGRWIFYRVAEGPEWVALMLRALAEGGVPARQLLASQARLARFKGRPLRLTRRVS